MYTFIHRQILIKHSSTHKKPFRVLGQVLKLVITQVPYQPQVIMLMTKLICKKLPKQVVNQVQVKRRLIPGK